MAPRIPYFDKPHSWHFFSDANDSVGMTRSETFVVVSCVSLHDLMIAVMSQKCGPESVNVGDALSFISRVAILFIRTT